ncbi:MAG: hypothetical protein JWM44_3044 [Bacilli bacterium]|nr:hypothetical protein [Bacilli bacterium]
MRLYIVNVVIIVLLLGTLLYLTPIGRDLRDSLAKHFIITRYQPYTWILVGHTKAELMIQELHPICPYTPDEKKLCL